jgi:hypothetical protein
MMGQAIAGVLALVMPVLDMLDTASVAAAVFTAAALLFTLLLVARSSARSPQVSPLPARVSATRANARRTAYLLLRDPDAAGRPRPRAPGQ